MCDTKDTEPVWTVRDCGCPEEHPEGHQEGCGVIKNPEFARSIMTCSYCYKQSWHTCYTYKGWTSDCCNAH
jgi:hypothetical protein